MEKFVRTWFGAWGREKGLAYAERFRRLPDLSESGPTSANDQENFEVKCRIKRLHIRTLGTGKIKSFLLSFLESIISSFVFFP